MRGARTMVVVIGTEERDGNVYLKVAPQVAGPGGKDWTVNDRPELGAFMVKGTPTGLNKNAVFDLANVREIRCSDNIPTLRNTQSLGIPPVMVDLKATAPHMSQAIVETRVINLNAANVVAKNKDIKELNDSLPSYAHKEVLGPMSRERTPSEDKRFAELAKAVNFAPTKDEKIRILKEAAAPRAAAPVPRAVAAGLSRIVSEVPRVMPKNDAADRLRESVRPRFGG